MLIIETTYNAQEKLWHGEDMEDIYDADQTIGELVFNALKENPTNVCQVCDSTSYIYLGRYCGQTLAMCIRLAQHFRDAGLTHEHIVGIVSSNNIHDTHVMFACLFNATPFHAVSPHQAPDVIAALFAITRPRLIFCDGNDYELIKAATRDWQPTICTLINHIAEVPKIEDHLKPTTSESAFAPRKLVLGANQTMGIICTSGTTGLPKAVTLSNAQLVLIGNTVGTREIIFSNAAIDWISGIKVVLTATVNGATRIVSNRTFSAERLVEIVRQHQVTACHLTYDQMSQVFNSALATTEHLCSLQAITYGGGWVPAKLVRAAQRVLEHTIFVCIYGTSETDIVAVALNPEVDNLVGKLVPGKSVRIVSEQGAYLGPKQIGEIVIQTNQAWSGYYGNAAQTAQTRDSAGWFYMGDLGYFDDDNNLYVIDRKKDALCYKGHRYTPNDIERIIVELPQVQAVCVVGIRDELQNEAAGALVVKQPDTLLSEQQVVRHVARRVSVEHKQLHAGVLFVDKLPYNANGKLMRNAAKDLFYERRLPRASL
ncbi:hypothetical protein KR093_008418 [Drosophila rubida]|uniref:Luciferin 4-monooxygenase n=1 Tax=Drosophila rubida TaxID=30044 RepID=A0AAD4K155_9MUSC|nr:hypothetical protein KR093_008418 [Drosophila rubida]